MITKSISYRHIIHLILTLQLTVAALLAAGCHGSSRDAITLDRAEALMEEHPDSALSLLRTTDSLNLRGRNAAIYNLLKAQACHKLGRSMPSDSALDISVDYFKKHHTDSLLIKSLFYRAECRKTNNDLQDAVCDANLSFDVASSIKDNYWQAKDAELLADIFEQCINYPDGIKWRRIAADRYLSSDRRDNYLFTLCDLARAYAVADSTRQADSLFRYIGHQIEKHPDNLTLKSYYTFAAFNYYALYAYGSNQALCDSLYGDLERFNMIKYLPPTVNIARAQMLANSSRFAEAEELLDSIRPHISPEIDRNVLFDAYVRLYSASGDLSARMAYSDSIINYQKQIVKTALNQSATAAQRNHYQQLSSSRKAEAERERRHLRNVMIIISLAIIAAGVLIAVYAMAKRREIDETRAIIGIISEQIEAKDEITAQLQQQLKDISKINEDLNQAISNRDQASEELSRKLAESDARFSSSSADRWETLNLLCLEISKTSDKASDKKNVSTLREVIGTYKSKEFLRKLENDLDRDMDHIVSRLRSQCPELKEDDISFCILNFSRIPTASIAILTGISITNCYVRRKRIRTKIMKSSAPDMEEFLMHIKG